MWLLLSVAIAGPNTVVVPTEFPTIQQALDRSNATRIEVLPGRYAGATIRRPVELVGVGASITSGPRIDGLGVGFVLTGRADDTTIEGFGFDCTSGRLDSGIYASSARFSGRADRVTVQDNAFVGCVQGITNVGRPVTSCSAKAVDGGRYWQIRDNVFDGLTTRADDGRPIGGLGIYLYNTRFHEVIANTFTGQVHDSPDFSTASVFTAGCWDCTIADNSFETAGARHFYAAVHNRGAAARGAAPSRNLFIVDNDATDDSAPHGDINYRSIGSFQSDVFDNTGVVWIDHTGCGDDDLRTFEE